MNQNVPIPLPHGITLTIKREDLLHPHISGNKFRKLKYNVLEAKQQGKTALLTFGGAYSNHIAAAAAAGREYGFATIGIIRGDELADKIDTNPNLAFAAICGMHFKFVSREDYRRKTEPEFLDALSAEFSDCYILPEGGTNALAVKGCEEILTDADAGFTHICLAVGTGGTISGVINAALPHQQVVGFPALKNAALWDDIRTFATNNNWQLAEDFHFGGYGKVTAQLVTFINDFYDKTGIPLDPVYTGKMVFGVIELAHQGFFPPQSRVLLIHTGGLQGVEGMNLLLKKKHLPTIKTQKV